MSSDGKYWWTNECMTCPHERVHQIEYRQLTANLEEVKVRVEKVETTLGRGVLLLVANLVAVLLTLFRAYLQS